MRQWPERPAGPGGLRWSLCLLDIPGLPRVPRLLGLLALREPRLVPRVLRWKAASGGLGLVVARLVASAPGDAAAVLGEIGEEQGTLLREQLGYGRDPVECARAVALANRLFGIAARVEPAPDGHARVRTPGCPWSRQGWWGTLPCGAFSSYEVGLVRGLNSRVRLRYLSKRTRGDHWCVGAYDWREGRGMESEGRGR
jgi:hypothetical protein